MLRPILRSCPVGICIRRECFNRCVKEDMKSIMRINIMALWKEFNQDAEKSMKDDFKAAPSPFYREIITYLKNGKVTLVAPSCAVDVISGERIDRTNCIMTDGEYTWSNMLIYYIQKYNLELPGEFVNKIMSMR